MIDVIVPVYNQENVVEKLLESLHNQSFKNFRVIIGDDKSTDNTLKTIETSRFSKKLNLILIKNKRNLGVTKNCNKLLDYSMKTSSKYILFTAGDDFLDSKTIEMKIEALENNEDAVMVGSKTFLVDINNEITGELDQRYEHDQVGNLNWVKHLNIWGTGGILWRKSMINFYFDERLKWASDFLFLVQNVSVNKVLFINKHLYYYRKSENSITINKKTKTKIQKDIFKSYLILLLDLKTNKIAVLFGLFNLILKKIFNIIKG